MRKPKRAPRAARRQRQPDPDAERLERLAAPEARGLALGARLRLGAGLLWAPQALALALGLQDLLEPGSGLSPIVAAALFFLAGALRAGLDAWGAEIAGAAAERAAERLRGVLISDAAAAAPTDKGRAPAGRMAALAADQAEALAPYLANYRPAKTIMTIQPVVFGLIAFALSWAAGLVLLLALPLAPVLMAAIGGAAKRASAAQMAEHGEMNAALLDRVRALGDVRLLGAAERLGQSFAAAAERFRAKTMAVLRIAFLNSAVIELVTGLGVAGVALWCAAALGGAAPFGAWSDAPLAPWAAAFLILLAAETFTPLRAFAAAHHERAAALALSAAVGELLERASGRRAPQRILGHGAKAPALVGAADIELQSAAIRWSAESDAGAVGPLSLRIPAGAHVALLGPSGSGKSTALAMIAGLARPSAGAIRVAGQPLNDETADAWRARLAWIGQTPQFLAGSLRANVAFFAPEGAADRARVDAALAQAGAAGVAARAPRGLDTRLGETGAGLSGGEGRRVGVARLAFAPRDVILADEPTADLDAETAAAVADGLIALAQGRTLIVATHDLALAQRLGRIVALDAEDAAPRRAPPAVGARAS